jgi:UTP--glucose-1-phosphate uridylyltransferase
MSGPVRKAVIPAAGLGTRFLPATKAVPKEMLPLVDKPAIQYVIEEAVGVGITDVLVITGRGKRDIEDHFDRSVELEELLAKGGKESELASMRAIADLAQVHFVRQGEPKGLGHAVGMGASTSATSRSRCSYPTTSPTRRPGSWPACWPPTSGPAARSSA